MKLLFCPKCQDVRKLLRERTECSCGESWGYYLEDGLRAEIGGIAIPLGFDNVSFKKALRAGDTFVVFFIKMPCNTIERRLE